MGFPSRSVLAGERALAMATGISDVTLEVVANYHLGLGCFLAGDFARTIKVYRRTEVILNGPLQNERFGMPAMPLVIARAWRSYCHACLGQFDEAAMVSLDTVRIAQSADHAYSIVVALEGAGLVEIVRGNIAAAVSWFERAAELARDGGFAVVLSIALSALGQTATLLGRTDAQAMIERAMEYADSIQFMAFRAADLTWLAYTHLWEGRPDQAMETIKRALDLAKTHEQGAMEAGCGRSRPVATLALENSIGVYKT
jgi:tetratricopeptide (TPR) repeat protein